MMFKHDTVALPNCRNKSHPTTSHRHRPLIRQKLGRPKTRLSKLPMSD